MASSNPKTKPTAAAAAETAAPEAAQSPIAEAMPTGGGSYTRQADGSLQRQAETVNNAPHPSEKPE